MTVCPDNTTDDDEKPWYKIKLSGHDGMRVPDNILTAADSWCQTNIGKDSYFRFGNSFWFDSKELAFMFRLWCT